MQRDTGNGRGEQIHRGKQHEPFVNVETATAEVKRGSDQDRENEHVAQRYDQELKRRRPGRGAARGPGNTREHADDHNQDGQDRSEHTETLMHSRAAGFDQRNLRDKKDDPGRHHDSVHMHEQAR